LRRRSLGVIFGPYGKAEPDRTSSGRAAGSKAGNHERHERGKPLHRSILDLGFWILDFGLQFERTTRWAGINISRDQTLSFSLRRFNKSNAAFWFVGGQHLSILDL
jgi:hypothetical protein